MVPLPRVQGRCAGPARRQRARNDGEAPGPAGGQGGAVRAAHHAPGRGAQRPSRCKVDLFLGLEKRREREERESNIMFGGDDAATYVTSAPPTMGLLHDAWHTREEARAEGAAARVLTVPTVPGIAVAVRWRWLHA